MQILYSYFRYTGRLFLVCALFDARCNTIRALWETKKKRLSYKKIYIEKCVWGVSIFGLHALLSMSLCCFFHLLPPPKWRTFRIIPIKCIFLCVLFCGISWVNTQKYGNLLQFNTTRFFYKQRFFFNSASMLLSFFTNWASNVT